MKKVLLAALAALTITILNAQSFEVDTKNSILNWTGYAEVGGYSQKGTINVSKGNMVLSDGELSELDVTVDVTSITSEEKDLESHLKEKDFFYIKKYPESSLVFKEKNNNEFLFDLTIRGITQTIAVPVNLEKTDQGYTATGKVTIDRTKFDIKYNSTSYFQDLGNYAIKNEFDLEFELVFRES
ncbi:MAG: YceI family protein [Bacteroidota bacterium]